MAPTQPAPLPSMPGTVIKLLQMFADPEVCINDVVDTLKTDAALAARILKAANSSTVAATREVSDLNRATMLLGKKTVSTLALSFSLADKSLQDDANAELFKSFWNQSLITGVAASVLAKKYGSLPHGEAFLVGLLSRIGRLGALSFAPEEFGATVEVSNRRGTSVDTAFLTSLGMNCEELTLQYMRSWMLPESFVTLVESMQQAGQRDRDQTAENTEKSETSPDASTSLRVSAALGQFFTGENPGVSLAMIHELMDPFFSDAAEDVETLIADVLEEFGSYSDLLDVDRSEFGTPAELHGRAMSHLTEIMMAPEAAAPATEESRSEVEWLKHRVSHLAEKLTLDSMTSIYNRAYFDMQLERRIAVCSLVNRHVAVLFVDINEFKQVNDVHGHDVGDAVICSVAHSLQAITRKDDVVARYGGDEFVMLCEMSEATGLESQAQRITKATEGLTATCRGLTVNVSLAIGGASALPDGSADFGDRLLRESDEAMYEAKQSRSNPVVRTLSATAAVTEMEESTCQALSQNR